MKRSSNALWALVLALGLLVVYWPVLQFALMGDDYQWVQHAHRASHQLKLLFADLDTFFRPANTWTLALDRALWGYWDGGFHASNLFWHWLATVLLALAANALGLPRRWSWAVAILWGFSPFAEESAVSVSIRFENLLLIAWLALVLWWAKSPNKGTTRPGVWLFLLLALASKESWVVTPVLVVLLTYAVSKKTLPASLAAALPSAALVGAYMGLYFWLFPGDKGYFSYQRQLVGKIPHMLAVFFRFQQPNPVAFPLTWQGLLAAALVILMAVFVVWRRVTPGLVGLFFLLATPLPTLFVPYLPQRYLAVPYAGFLLLGASWLQQYASSLPKKAASGWLLGGSALALLVFMEQLFWVRADLRDWQRVSQAHRRLVQQARQALPLFPLDRPVVVVRGDRTNVLREITTTQEGWPKLFYLRGSDPGGLIDAPALFEWVLAREDLEVRPLDVLSQPSPAPEGAVFLYHANGFALLHEKAQLKGALAPWRAAGLPARGMQAHRLPQLRF